MFIQPEVSAVVRDSHGRRFALAHGCRALVREATVEDADGLRAMFARCSPETIRLRFHLPYRTVPEPVVRLLVDATGRGGRAFVALSGSEVVGHSMYAGEEGDEHEAEVAVVVEDGWQSGGWGGMLLSVAAEEARRDGFEALVCFTLWENRRVLGLARRAFCGASARYVGGTLSIRVPLSERREEVCS